MDTVADFRRKTGKPLIILSVSALVLIALIVGAVVGTVAHSKNKNGDGAPATISAAIKSFCSVNESCFVNLNSSNLTVTELQKGFQNSMAAALDSLNKLFTISEENKRNNEIDKMTERALWVCSDMEQTMISLKHLIALTFKSKIQLAFVTSELAQLLTEMEAYQQKCFAALDESGMNATVVNEIKSLAKNSTNFVIIGANYVSQAFEKIRLSRRLLGEVEADSPAAERRLRPKTVAKDGSGDVPKVN